LIDANVLDESVSYLPYDNETDANLEGSKVEAIDALQEKQTKEEKDHGDLSTSYNRSRVYDLRVSHLLGTVVTRRGMILDSAGIQWIVTKVELKSFRTRWRCECYALNG
jgi:hypothetical protein